jgi:Peroxiredoxin
MAQITFKGKIEHTSGNLPEIGRKAPNFQLIGQDLELISSEQFLNRRLIISIFPSLDTSVCAASVRHFNEEASKLENTTVLCVSRDLPFAHHRFCTTEEIENVVTGSDTYDYDFGQNYGVSIVDGPLRNLLARSIVIVDEKGIVTYTHLIVEQTEEPDYKHILKKLRRMPSEPIKIQ